MPPTPSFPACLAALAIASPLSAQAEPAVPLTPIHVVQGRGGDSPLLGTQVAVRGVLLRCVDWGLSRGGCYVQAAAGESDDDPATAEGLWVEPEVASGDAPVPGTHLVAEGTVVEREGMTGLSGARVEALGVAELPAATPLRLPVGTAADWEALEGMRVRIDQVLTVTGQAALAEDGVLQLSSGGRLFAPTAIAEPGREARARTVANRLRLLQLDDGSFVPRPRPLPHAPPGEAPRLGDRLRGLDAVVDGRGAPRVQPLDALRFERTELRPSRPPLLDGALRIAALNVQALFVGSGGALTGERGARDAEELTRQLGKLAATLAALDADVIALAELENAGDDGAAARAALLQALEEAGASAYEAIEPPPGSLGDHPIAVGLLYRPARVAPAGPARVLKADARDGPEAARRRPALAQRFAPDDGGAPFTVATAHLRSRIAPCDDDPGLDDGQGPCNVERTRAARALAHWLTSDAVARDADVLLVGDLNAEPREEPLSALADAGFVDMIARHADDTPYSHVHDGRAGRLDHALASPRLAARVSGALVWHVNADEAPARGYARDNPAELYAPDPFRSSDHDPIVVALDGAATPDADAEAEDARATGLGPHAGGAAGETRATVGCGVANPGGRGPVAPLVVTGLLGARTRRRACRRPSGVCWERSGGGSWRAFPRSST